MVDHGPQCLLARCHRCRVLKLWIDGRVFRDGFEFAEAIHVVEEGAHAVLEPRAREHPVDCTRATLFGQQFTTCSRLQQFGVGRCVPEKIAKPRRERIAIDAQVTWVVRVRFGAINDEQHVGAQQHRFERDFQARIKIAQRVHCQGSAVGELFDFGACQRPPVEQATRG